MWAFTQFKMLVDDHEDEPDVHRLVQKGKNRASQRAVVPTPLSSRRRLIRKKRAQASPPAPGQGDAAGPELGSGVGSADAGDGTTSLTV